MSSTVWPTPEVPFGPANPARRSRRWGASLLAVRAGIPIGIATILWVSDYAGFRDRGIPLLHQITVDEASAEEEWRPR